MLTHSAAELLEAHHSLSGWLGEAAPIQSGQQILQHMTGLISVTCSLAAF